MRHLPHTRRPRAAHAPHTRRTRAVGFATDAIALLRFAPDGSPLAPVDALSPGYQGSLGVDSTGSILGTSSGYGSVSLAAPAFSRTLDTQDPDWVPSGVAGAATGDILWLYQIEDNGWPATSWVARRYTAAGALSWSLSRRGTSSPLLGPLGLMPLELAAGPSGELAVGGTYTGLSYTGGAIQTFAP